LTAACFASEGKNRVVLFEKQKKPGRKILASGNGKCNISNTGIDASRYHGHHPDFVRNLFGRFGLEETEAFFLSLGVPFCEENLGRLFPESRHSVSVMDQFKFALKKKGVEQRIHRRVDSVTRRHDSFELTTAGREKERFDRIILATGSCAWPALGGSDSGYRLASSLGLTIREPFPSIVPLNIPLKPLHRLQGIRWECGVRVWQDTSLRAGTVGEVQFTGYGISGPATLDVSRHVNEAVVKSLPVHIELDLFPEYSERELKSLVDTLLSDHDKPVATALNGLLRRGMPEFFLGQMGIDQSTPSGKLRGDQVRTLTGMLKSMKLEPGEPRGFHDAVVAAGGVDVAKIDPVTMEAREIPGLHVAGELLDIDGDSGGFNLQFAWSSGALAGMACC
jgi:hypothetical protein